MKKHISLILVASILSLPSAFAAPNYSYQGGTQNPAYQQSYYPTPMTNQNTLKGRVVTVPSGQIFKSYVTTPISSQYLTTGQCVTISMASDFIYNGNVIAPAGSSVVGNVIEVQKARHGSLNGKLCIRFTQIITPAGMQIPISAIIKTSDGTGVLTAGTKMDVTKEYAKDAVVGSAAGALTGLVFGAIAGGSIGKATAIGTAIGAGGGLVKSGIDKGKDVEIPAGATLELMLTQPITTSPSAYSYE